MTRPTDASVEDYIAARASGGQLAAVATEATGHVAGGAVGRIWGRCCELLQLWVAPEFYRKYGYVVLAESAGVKWPLVPCKPPP